MKRDEVIADIVKKIMILSDAKLEGVYDFVNFLSDRSENKIKQQEEIYQRQVVLQHNHYNELSSNHDVSLAKEIVNIEEISSDKELILNQTDENKVNNTDNLPDVENKIEADNDTENFESESHTGFDFFQDEKAF